MFGWFKRKPAPEGPVEITLAADIDVSAEDFFARIDFASPRNVKSELGHHLEKTGDNQFRLVMSFMPDLEFHLTVEESSPPTRYSYFSPIPEGVGRLKWTRETYEIAPTGEASCHVTFHVVGEFGAGMTMSEYRNEVEMLTTGCHNSLAKVKIHAEGGFERVRQFERYQAE